MRANRDAVAALLATAAFVVVVSLGFWKTRGPSTQRLVRWDEKRVHNLSQLAGEIIQDYRTHDMQLPTALSSVQKGRYLDPATGRPPDYRVEPPSHFFLCTTFATEGPRESPSGNYLFWAHSGGRKCFEFDATEPVPPAPFPYY